MIQVVVFVPESHLDVVKRAMFAAGAGKMGNYDSCCFESKGQGQFRALHGSQAFIGDIGQLEKVSEVRLEMACEDQLLEQVILAMKKTHPYETPAYYGIKTLSL